MDLTGDSDNFAMNREVVRTVQGLYFLSFPAWKGELFEISQHK